MNLFIQKYILWDQKQTLAFIGERTDEQVVAELMSWEENPECALIGIDHFYQILPEITVQYFRIKLKPWAEQWKAEKFLNEATAFEFQSCKVNPFYPMNAFNVKFDACVDLMSILKVVVDKQAVAYALVCRHLHDNKSMNIQEASNMFAMENLGEFPDIGKVLPFPADHLDTHPLRDVDLNTTPPAHMADLVRHRGELSAKIRELKNMTNQVVKIGDTYKWITCSIAFAKNLKRIQVSFKSTKKAKMDLENKS